MHGLVSQFVNHVVDEAFHHLQNRYTNYPFQKKWILVRRFYLINSPTLTPHLVYYEIQNNYRTLTPHFVFITRNYIRYSIADTSFAFDKIFVDVRHPRFFLSILFRNERLIHGKFPK